MGNAQRRVRTGVRRVAVVLVAAGGLATAVTPAMASTGVSGSTSWGSYSCTHVSVSGGAGDHQGHFSGDCTVTDKAADGHGVYIQFNGIRNGLFDTGWQRTGPNASGKGHSYSAHKELSSAGVDYWKFRVCKQVANVADPCSAADVAT